MMDHQQTPGAAAQSATQSSNENRSFVEHLRPQNLSPEMCTLLLGQNTSSLHGFCLVDVLERLQGLFDKTSAVIQKNYDELKTMAMENRNEIIKLQGRLNLFEKQMTELRREVGILLNRVTKLEVKKPKVQITDSAPTDESHKYTAMSLEQASAQHPQLKPKTSIEAQQTMAPQAMEPYRDVDTSKSNSSDSGREPDCDYDPRRVPPYLGEAERVHQGERLANALIQGGSSLKLNLYWNQNRMCIDLRILSKEHRAMHNLIIQWRILISQGALYPLPMWIDPWRLSRSLSYISQRKSYWDHQFHIYNR